MHIPKPCTFLPTPSCRSLAIPYLLTHCTIITSQLLKNDLYIFCYTNSFLFNNFVNIYHICISVVREPPYQCAETGYGGFIFPIDVYLRNNTVPKKIRFQYELFLSVEGSISQSRYERIVFESPSDVFLSRLLLAGAVRIALELI